MFTDDNSIDSLHKLYAEFKKYLGLQREYVMLELTEKLGILLSLLLVLILVAVLSLVALFYLSFMLVSILTPHIGAAGSFGLIAGFHILLIIVIVALRHRLIIAPMLRFMARLLLDEPNDGDGGPSAPK